MAAVVYGQSPAAEPLPPDAIEPPMWPRSSRTFTTPDPFSLNGYDALQAMAFIRREGLLIRQTGNTREIVPVRTVEAVEVDSIEEYPPMHRQRFDLELNGELLEWDRLYITYGGRLVNLQILFTYRNQRPVPDTPYFLD